MHQSMALDHQNKLQHLIVTIPSPATIAPLPNPNQEEEVQETKKEESVKEVKNEEKDGKNQKEGKDVKEEKEGKERKEKFTDKAMLNVSILIAAVSAAAILNIPFQFPKDPVFKRFYKLYTIFTFITFTVGVGCVVLCSILHKPDKNLAVTKGAMWVGLIFLELSMVLGALLKVMIWIDEEDWRYC